MYEERIQKGIDFLNKNVKDWHKDINTDNLDLYCGVRCILGQLSKGEGFSKELNRLNMSHDESVQHGFMIDKNNSNRIASDILTSEWKEAIIKLRSDLINTTKQENSMKVTVDEPKIVKQVPVFPGIYRFKKEKNLMVLFSRNKEGFVLSGTYSIGHYSTTWSDISEWEKLPDGSKVTIEV